MSINDVTPQEIANHHQAVGVKSISLTSSHRAARKANDDRKCDLHIESLETLDVDSLDYFEQLLKDDNNEH